MSQTRQLPEVEPPMPGKNDVKFKNSKKWIALPINPYNSNKGLTNPANMRNYSQNSQSYSSDSRHYWHLTNLGHPPIGCGQHINRNDMILLFLYYIHFVAHWSSIRFEPVTESSTEPVNQWTLIWCDLLKPISEPSLIHRPAPPNYYIITELYFLCFRKIILTCWFRL